MVVEVVCTAAIVAEVVLQAQQLVVQVVGQAPPHSHPVVVGPEVEVLTSVAFAQPATVAAAEVANSAPVVEELKAVVVVSCPPHHHFAAG